MTLTQRLELPYRAAGLDERQAAAYLLDRLGYGARPGEIGRVVGHGLVEWVERQLDAALSDRALERKLKPLDALGRSAREIVLRYPPTVVVLREAREAGVLPADVAPQGLQDPERRELRARLVEFARGRGYRPQRELEAQLVAQKLFRVATTENVLREQLVDFWFNHFNVSTTKNACRPYVLSYERDAIRPHVLGRFRDLLGASAAHPAMLLYLDNAQSVADPDARTTLDAERERAQDSMPRRGRRGARGEMTSERPPRSRERGLNENYARELLELHTLGVDGGYAQQDVVAAARAFTGWTVYPPAGPARERVDRALARARRQGGAGAVVRGDFLFRPDAHDAGEKVVLGVKLPAGRGIEDGERVLDLVARHAATARRIATKLARRFVADDPPEALVGRLSATFRDSDGDIRATLVALVESAEFWAGATRREKIKSPLELAGSALRALGADLGRPRAVAEWVARMGEPLYAYQAPTGYPDRAEHWVNTGSLLNRMNFGLDLAARRLPGVQFDLVALAGGTEPESTASALAVYAAALLPGRDVREVTTRVAALAADPTVAERVAEQAAEAPAAPPAMDEEALVDAAWGRAGDADREGTAGGAAGHPGPSLAHVVGILLGSPEFQRR